MATCMLRARLSRLQCVLVAQIESFGMFGSQFRFKLTCWYLLILWRSSSLKGSMKWCPKKAQLPPVFHPSIHSGGFFDTCRTDIKKWKNVRLFGQTRDFDIFSEAPPKPYRWLLEILFYVHSFFGEMIQFDPIWRSWFSDGLNPSTRKKHRRHAFSCRSFLFAGLLNDWIYFDLWHSNCSPIGTCSAEIPAGNSWRCRWCNHECIL